jgi:type I restriction enzyme S subunit
MIADLKPYPEYKESGQEWLGHVPSHWEVRRTKFLLREMDSRSMTGREQLLRVSQYTGVTQRKSADGSDAPDSRAASLKGYKIVHKSDLVINIMLAWNGSMGVSRFDGIVSPAYCVYRLNPEVMPWYFHELLRLPAYKGRIKSASTGVVESRLRLYSDDLGCIEALLPPPAEQAAIVRFLDHWNGRLEKAIRSKRKQLSLISEMLVSVTQEAMASSKNTIRIWSGVEIMSRPVDRDSTPSFVRVGLYNRGRGIFQKPACPGDELGDSDFYWIEEGDLVISGQFAWEGSVALVRSTESGCIASHRYPVIRGRKEVISSSALLAILRSSYGAMILNENSRGAAGRNRPLNFRSLLKERIPIPSFDDQRRIADLLEQEHAVSQSLMRLTKFINEYRTRLTADVVTGKLDVRAAAAQLPEEAEEEPLPDPEVPEEETELEEVEG